jgi:hypothetical protein
MTSQDSSAQHRALVAVLLRAYGGAVKQELLSRSSILGTPSATNSMSSAYIPSLLESPPATSSQARLRNSLSPSKSRRGESAFDLSNSGYESFGPDTMKRSYSMPGHGRICQT